MKNEKSEELKTQSDAPDGVRVCLRNDTRHFTTNSSQLQTLSYDSPGDLVEKTPRTVIFRDKKYISILLNRPLSKFQAGIQWTMMTF